FLCFVTVAVVAGAIRARPESSGIPVICGGGAEPCFAPGQTPVTGRATAPMTSPHAAAPAEPRSSALRRDGDCWGEGTGTWTSHSIRGHAMRGRAGNEPDGRCSRGGLT